MDWLKMDVNNFPQIDGPRMADACEQVKGCLNGDIFKFGPIVAGVLIAALVLKYFIGIGLQLAGIYALPIAKSHGGTKKNYF